MKHIETVVVYHVEVRFNDDDHWIRNAESHTTLEDAIRLRDYKKQQVKRLAKVRIVKVTTIVEEV
jgi:hypothetical protein